MSIGDVNSDARGSGARFNDGKLQMDLIPVSFWIASWEEDLTSSGFSWLASSLEALSAFQMGDDEAVASMLASMPGHFLEGATEVLVFGAEKYAKWNWAKGMAWSIPTSCILRHARAIIDGDEIDSDSGLDHFSHIVCNLIFLAWFVDHYKEGDDRPPVSPVDELVHVGGGPLMVSDPLAPGRFIHPTLINPVIGGAVMDGNVIGGED